jgi:hypothetical protein
MRRALCLVLSLLTFSFLYAQDNVENPLFVDGKLYLDSIYSNKDEMIIFSGIHIFDGLSQAELKTRVKNWASLSFVNLKEVLVSETDDQIVLNYISSAFYAKSLGAKATVNWYLRLLIQFKDGKIRCTYYDDGNVRMLASQYSPGVSARALYLKDYFKKQDEKLVCGKQYAAGMANLQNSIRVAFSNIKTSIESNSVQKQDW